MAIDAPVEIIAELDALPEGEYARDEVIEALDLADDSDDAGAGIPADRLTDDDLLRELGELHRTRHETLRHGSDQALSRHTERMAELENEYLRRYPEREIDPERLRSGARARTTVGVQPLEDSDEVAWAVADDAPVPALAPGDDEREPTLFREPTVAPVIRTGADQPWDPEDLALAQGRDPTPENIERARRELERDGPAAIEKTVP